MTIIDSCIQIGLRCNNGQCKVCVGCKHYFIHYLQPNGHYIPRIDYVGYEVECHNDCEYFEPFPQSNP